MMVHGYLGVNLTAEGAKVAQRDTEKAKTGDWLNFYMKFKNFIGKKEYLQLYFSLLLRSRAIVILLIIGLYVIVSGIINYKVNKDISALNGALVSLFILPLYFVELYILANKNYSRCYNNGDCYLTLTGETIIRTNGTVSMQWAWLDVVKVSEDNKCFYLFLKKKVVLFLKKAYMTNEEQQELSLLFYHKRLKVKSI